LNVPVHTVTFLRNDIVQPGAANCLWLWLIQALESDYGKEIRFQIILAITDTVSVALTPTVGVKQKISIKSIQALI